MVREVVTDSRGTVDNSRGTEDSRGTVDSRDMGNSRDTGDSRAMEGDQEDSRDTVVVQEDLRGVLVRVATITTTTMVRKAVEDMVAVATRCTLSNRAAIALEHSFKMV